MNKTVSLLIIFSFLISSVSFGQQQQQQARDKAFYDNKITKFKSMRRTGTVMIITGGVLLVSGIYIASQATWQSQSTTTGSNYTSNDPSGFAGTLFATLGTGLLAGGIVTTIISNNKLKKYQSESKGVVLNLLYLLMVPALD